MWNDLPHIFLQTVYATDNTLLNVAVVEIEKKEVFFYLLVEKQFLKTSTSLRNLTELEPTLISKFEN